MEALRKISGIMKARLKILLAISMRHWAVEMQYFKLLSIYFVVKRMEGVWSVMCRCWTLEPTSARIVEDIEALPRVLNTIIAHNGCVAPDEAFRNGRRAQTHDGKKILKRKPVARQRISTLKCLIIHQDVVEARDNLIKNNQVQLPFLLHTENEYIYLLS